MDLPTRAPTSDSRSEQINKLLEDKNFRTETFVELLDESEKLQKEIDKVLEQIRGPDAEDKINLLYESLFIHETCLETVEQFKANLELCDLESLTPEEGKKLELRLIEIFKLYHAQEQLWKSEDFRRGFLEGWHYAFRKAILEMEEEK